VALIRANNSSLTSSSNRGRDININLRGPRQYIAIRNRVIWQNMYYKWTRCTRRLYCYCYFILFYFILFYFILFYFILLLSNIRRYDISANNSLLTSSSNRGRDININLRGSRQYIAIRNRVLWPNMLMQFDKWSYFIRLNSRLFFQKNPTKCTICNFYTNVSNY